MEQAHTIRFSERQKDCAWIVLLWSLPIFLLRPFQNTPFVDDWVYAWSVENLLKTGSLKILDWSTSVNPAQVLWGALFCLPHGFSFTALRISTWVLSAAALCGLYLLLREIGVDRVSAWIGAATMGVYPVYFLLSYTFMTDVPFVCFSVWCLYAMIRMGPEFRLKWLAVAVVFACLATATRLTGLAFGLTFPIIAILGGVVKRRHWGTIALCILPLLFLGSLLLWHSYHVEARADLKSVENSPIWRAGNLKYAFLGIHTYLVSNWLFWTVVLGFVLLPIGLGRVGRENWRRVWLTLGFCILVILIRPAIKGRLFPPFGSMWAVSGIAEWEGDVPPPPQKGPPLPDWHEYAIANAATFLFALAAGSTSRIKITFTSLALACVIVVNFLQMAVLWLFADRYILMVLAPIIALMLLGASITRKTLSTAALVLLAAFAWINLHDYLSYNRAVFGGLNRLLASGVSPSDIDGGYVINGWLQYARSENAHRDAQGGVAVNEVNDDSIPARFRVSNSIQRGWSVLESISYRRWLAKSGEIYVLAKVDAP